MEEGSKSKLRRVRFCYCFAEALQLLLVSTRNHLASESVSPFPIRTVLGSDSSLLRQMQRQTKLAYVAREG